MQDITKVDVWIAGLKVVLEAPQIVIPLLVLVAGFVWWFRGIITQATTAALAEQNTAISERLKLAQERETDVRQKMDALEKTVKDLNTAKRTSTELATD